MIVRGNIRLAAQGAESSLSAWLALDLAGALGRLYVNNVPYDPENGVSAYVEASWPGYSASPLAPFVGPYDRGAGLYQIDASPCLWQYLAQAGSFPVYGVYVTDATNTKLLLVIPFVNPTIVSPQEPPIVQQVSILARSQAYSTSRG